MIESVYSNENAEVSQTDRVHIEFKMPKNIRQIGKSNSSKKIYVEDYVMTYTKQLPGEDYSACRVAVLLGQYVKLEQGRCIFISGAVEVEGLDLSEGIVFTNDHWTAIYENIKKYFVDAEIVGWFIGGPGYLLEDKERILKAHIDNFAGQDKTLLTFDNMEKEETFYFYENGSLGKQEGFYIYYEKNEEMQNYMIDNKESPSQEEHYDDRVSRDIRTILQSKKPAEDNKTVSHLMYAAGTLLAVIILVVGAAMLSNYDQMKNMQNSINTLTNSLKEVETVFLRNENDKATPSNNQIVDDTPVINNGSLDIEVVSGGVSPLPDKDLATNRDEDKTIDSASEAQKEDLVDNNQEDRKETSSVQNSKTNSKQEINYYTVKAGDSLLGISNRLYNSANYVTEIKRLNNIEDEDMIYIGQKLILP